MYRGLGRLNAAILISVTAVCQYVYDHGTPACPCAGACVDGDSTVCWRCGAGSDKSTMRAPYCSRGHGEVHLTILLPNTGSADRFGYVSKASGISHVRITIGASPRHGCRVAG